MNNRSIPCRGASTVSLLIGMALLAVSITGALKLMDVSIRAQNNLNIESLVDQVNRISEIVTVHLNRGGSYQNPDVEAKGIQLCSLQDQAMRCNGYQSTNRNFCLSIPTRVSRSGSDVIKLTGFRLFNGVLAQRELASANMAQFDHGVFCASNPAWTDLNNARDFEFSNIRFCRFQANTAEQVTQNFEQNCSSVIENNPESNMFWVGMFKANIGNKLPEGQYEEVRIIHLLNTTRVRIGS